MGIPIEQSFLEISEKELSARDLEELISIFRAKY